MGRNQKPKVQNSKNTGSSTQDHNNYRLSNSWNYQPFSSPIGAEPFFVEKKNKSLQPCINFCGLNNIIVKTKYPLPILTSAFELLQGATIFSKLNL